MKYKLIMYSKFNTEEKFKFDSIENLFNFIEKYTLEYLKDRNIAELKYDIIFEERLC